MAESLSQNQKIEYHLQKMGSITALEAWDSYVSGAFRVGSKTFARRVYTFDQKPSSIYRSNAMSVISLRKSRPAISCAFVDHQKLRRDRGDPFWGRFCFGGCNESFRFI